MSRHGVSVAVCIPTYNQSEYLALAVKSALEQDWPGPIEVWVGDDASTDSTPELLKDYEERKSVHVIRRAMNMGVGANSADLMSRPTSDFVLRLDSDDLVAPNFISRMLPALLADPGLGYAHSAVEEIDEAGRARRVRSLGRRTGSVSADDALRASLLGYRTTANVILFRRSALIAVDNYANDVDFVEDYDLSVRLAAAGWGNFYSSEVLASYRVWTDQQGHRNKRLLLQLVAHKTVFDRSLGEAWAARNWNLAQVDRQRRRFVLGKLTSVYAVDHSRAERAALVEALLAIEAGARVKAAIALCEMGGWRALEGVNRIKEAPRRSAKTLVRLAARYRRHGGG